MAHTYYINGAFTGNTPHPVTGVANVCGPDTADPNAGDDAAIDPTNPATPLLSLTGLQFLTTDPGDTIYLAGRLEVDVGLEYAFQRDDSGGGLTFLQWPGREPWQIRGDSKPGGTRAHNITISATYWVASGNGWYMHCDGTNGKLDLTAVVVVDAQYDYDDTANIEVTDANAMGARKCTLIPYAYDGTSDASTIATMLALTPAAGYGYWFQGTHALAGRLAVLLPTGKTPANAVGNGVGVSIAGRGGIAFKSGTGVVNTGVVVDGGAIVNFPDTASTSPLGTSLYVENGRSCSWSNMRFERSGIHALSLGTSMQNCVGTNNVYVGCGKSTTNAGIPWVCNPGGTATASGIREYNPLMYLHSLLRHDGAPMSNAAQIIGFFAHTSSSGVIGDVEIVNPRVYCYTPSVGTQDVAAAFRAKDTAAPSDTLNPETYGFRVRQTNPAIRALTNGADHRYGTDVTNLAYINCRLDYGAMGTTAGGYQYAHDMRGGATGTLGLFGCEVTVKNQTTNSRQWAGIGAGMNLELVGCSFYDYRTTNVGVADYSWVRYGAAGATVAAYQCVFAFLQVGNSTWNNRVCVNDTDASYNDGTGHTFRDCVYWNVTATAWSSNTALNATAEWAAVVDTNGIVPAANPYATTAGTGTLEPTAAVKALTKRVATHAVLGVNRLPYDGHYGAWQYGGSAYIAYGMYGMVGLEELASKRRR